MATKDDVIDSETDIVLHAEITIFRTMTFLYNVQRSLFRRFNVFPQENLLLSLY